MLGDNAIDVSVLIRAVDKFTKPAERIANVSDKMGKAFVGAQKRLDDLYNKQNRLKRLAGELERTGRHARFLSNIKTALAGTEEKIAQTTNELNTLGTAQDKVNRATERFVKAQQSAANVALIAQGAQGASKQILELFTSPIAQMRSVEKSIGDIQTLGIQDTASIVNKGKEMQKQYAYMDTARFVAASYDIKSGISSLSDTGVADMTAAAGITAKATKADIAQMTSLFATAYGTFKGSLYNQMSDKDFGATLSAGLAKSVQQFKTTGAAMQQSIQSMGSGLANVGISMTSQITALGMLQQKMDAGVAGNVMKSLAAGAGKAQQNARKMGLDIDILDAKGNLKELPVLLEEMQQAFGGELTSQTSAQLIQLFGREEAAKFFESLWGMQDMFRSNEQAIKKATHQGMKFTDAMAQAADDNMDARLQKVSQRFELVKMQIGYAFVPVLERLLPIVTKIADGFSWLADNGGTSVSILATLVAGIAAVGLVVSPLIMAFATLGVTMAWARKRVAALSAAATAMTGGTGGGVGSKGKWLKWLKGAGIFGAGMTALSIGSTMLSNQEPLEKTKAVAKDLGGMGGMWVGGLAGAKAGALIGSIVPGIGTAIGGAIGGILGGIGGSILGNVGGEMVADIIPTNSQTSSTTHQTNTFNITTQPEQDNEEIADMVIRRWQAIEAQSDCVPA